VAELSDTLLGGGEAAAPPDGREHEGMEAVGLARRVHGVGKSNLPHSVFLRFPHDPAAASSPRRRSWAAGWIASFPHDPVRGSNAPRPPSS
jgi:hypothetical protein